MRKLLEENPQSVNKSGKSLGEQTCMESKAKMTSQTSIQTKQRNKGVTPLSKNRCFSIEGFTRLNFLTKLTDQCWV